MDEERLMGPVSYVIVEFPGGKMTGQGFPLLVDLVDRGLIRILDLRFVTKSAHGSVRTVELTDVDHDGVFDFNVFDGVYAGIIDSSDIDDAASVIEPGSSAGILIFENGWAASFTRAMRRGGAEVVAAGYIPADAPDDSLNLAEAGYGR